jgi:hypothetical protein
MAKKIFRIHNNGVTSESGWFDSATITSQELNEIITDGKGIATSIPSPFARIDLVKSAFQWVSQNNIDGNTAQHKLVSDALDVGQLFFLSGLYKELEIIEWNPNKRFEELKKGVHKDFIDTLETYWKQDGNVYNFDSVNRLFFILYNKRLIGGTSPSTLFFAAPDANSQSLNMNIRRGSDKLLDNKYASLAKREWSYIEYIFALSKTSQFMQFFTVKGKEEFYNYLQAVKRSLSHEEQLKIDNIDNNSNTKYKKCFVTTSEDNFCDVLGVPLGLQIKEASNIERSSDFVIKSELSDKKPLVLPNNRYSDGLCYTTSDVKWDADTMHKKIPYRNEKSEKHSKLPVYGDNYYWLSIGNFLEDKIIELPYELDASNFELCGSTKYLLPLTKTFFEYFKTEDINKLFKVIPLTGGGVEVKLEIPVKCGRNIPFSKIYNHNDIEKLEVHLAIFPFIKVEDFPLKYNVGIIDGDFENNDKNVINTSFYKTGNKIESSKLITRSHGGNKIKSGYLSTNGYFDSIQLTFNNTNCFIIPKMPVYKPGAANYNFAIDFGTTNTHIEYNKDGETQQPLKNEMPNNIWASLLDKNANVDALYVLNEATFEQEIIPHTIGNNDLSFPLRTALVENKDIDFNQERELFKHLNNFFLYEKQSIQSHLELTTSLKWSNYSKSEDKKRVESYIEFLLTIVFYKVLLSNGKLDRTKIIWFYPISMTNFQQGVIEDSWKKAYKKVFGKFAHLNNLTKMPESIAPFFYYQNQKGILGLSVSIDIGGGSSDISIFDDGQAKTISSFRFSGDSIYGDGYGGSPSVNGFVKAFKEDALTYLNSNDFKKKEKLKILTNILETKGNSSDFSSYLFSLEKSSSGLFDYSGLIKEEMNLKLSILIFYSAIGFYVSKILKAEGYEVPRNYLFSGTGAKSIEIIDSSSDLVHISGLMKYMAEKVLGKNAKTVVSKLSEIPKEITCKGGLLKSSDNEVATKFWLGGSEKSEWDLILDATTFSEAPKFNDCSPENFNYIIDTVEEFYTILDNYFKTINITNDFGIKKEAYDKFKEMRSDQLLVFLKKGVELKVESEGGNSNIEIEESLFFYPLIGVLNKLALKLATKE